VNDVFSAVVGLNVLYMFVRSDLFTVVHLLKVILTSPSDIAEHLFLPLSLSAFALSIWGLSCLMYICFNYIFLLD
jgi:hypothetical protein